MKTHHSSHSNVIGQGFGQNARLHTARMCSFGQPRRTLKHASRAVQAVVKTPSTEEPKKAPGSESNFTGLPERKQDIPITSPTSPNKQMQASQYAHACIHLQNAHPVIIQRERTSLL